MAGVDRAGRPAALLTATRARRPAQVTAELLRLLPEHGFELLSLTTPDPVCAEHTLIVVRHPMLAAAACAADPAQAAPLLTATLSVRAAGAGSVAEVLDPAAAARGAAALAGIADRQRYLLAAALCAVGGAPAAIPAPPSRVVPALPSLAVPAPPPRAVAGSAS